MIYNVRFQVYRKVTQLYIYVCVCVCVYIYTHMCIYVHIHICVHIYIHTHTYTPMYMYTHIYCCGCLVTKSCPTLVTPWFIAHQAPLPMGFPRQEYWSGLPFPSPGDLPSPGIEPASPALTGGFSTNSTTWEAPIKYISK